MSIFDRLWGAAKKTEAPPATARPGVGSEPGDAVTGDRRHRKRRNARHGAKALIIDDSATVVAALRRILRSAGYATREAMDAEQGLAMIQQEQPDLVFLDIILPGMNGFGALRVIRKDPVTQHIPVIMISGNEHATEQFYANRIGADDFMKKPFSRYEVFARIENLLDANRVPRRKGESGAHAAAPATAGGPPAEVSAARVTVPGAAPTAAPASAGHRWSALDARKELTAMGLQYFDQHQFFAAIRRADKLAVELFLASGGMALEQPLDGKTALGLARELGNPSVLHVLQNASRLAVPG
jgi:twitching motility two-component system response regulator PilH